MGSGGVGWARVGRWDGAGAGRGGARVRVVLAAGPGACVVHDVPVCARHTRALTLVRLEGGGRDPTGHDAVLTEG